MKKLLFLALGFAFFATSSSTKENQMNTTDVDSTMISADSSVSATIDSSAVIVVDSAGIPVDSAATIPTTK